MKKVFASLALAFLVSFASFAGDDSKPVDSKKAAVQTAVYPSASARLNVIVDNATDRSVTVRVLNEKGAMLAEQTIGKSKKPTISRFDLSQLTDGVYQVEISNGDSREVKQIKLQTSQPTQEVTRNIAIN